MCQKSKLTPLPCFSSEPCAAGGHGHEDLLLLYEIFGALVQLNKFLRYAEQRGLEHHLYKKFESTASKANGGLNKIKAISDKSLKSTKGQKYLNAAEDFLKKQ